MFGLTRGSLQRMPDVDAALAGIELRDADERAVRLGDLWRERPVVLVFIRHFG
jgi:hypothetical protein